MVNNQIIALLHQKYHLLIFVILLFQPSIIHLFLAFDGLKFSRLFSNRVQYIDRKLSLVKRCNRKSSLSRR